MSEQEFITELKKIGIELSENQIRLFRAYLEFLLKYNEHTNLTAIRDKEGVYLKHFYDSLILYKNIESLSGKVLDIGSGAGFPGVPLKIVNPSINLTLLDSNGKKTKFLNELKKELDIDYTVLNGRAEDIVKEYREQFDYVVSRAVTTMSVLAELTIPFVKIGGHFIAYKGQIDDSLENGIFAINTLGGKVENVFKEKLPIIDAERNLVDIIKVCKTDDIYPRNYDKINKKPLQKK